MFIGRSEELGLLEKLYAKNSLNVVLVSGEYKIGKTALLQEFLQKKSAAYFVARNALSTVNLAAFCLELKEQGLWGSKNDFRSWDSVLSALFFRATQQQLVLVVDDVQYLFDSAPEFFTAFGKYAQKYKKQLRLLVILAGAPFTDMERVLLKNQELQIKNYINDIIKLGAMDYWEAQPFLEGFTDEEKLCLYGAAGGNPHYMSYFDRELSFKDNLKKLFFESSAPLYKEPIQLLKLELREPATYNTILCSIACGAGRLNEIAAAADMECNKVSKYLNVLLRMGVLRRVNPAFGTSNKISYYEITNNMFVFWYQFVFPYMSSIAIGRGNQVLRNNIMPRIDLFASYIFQKICLQYCYKLKKRNDFMCDFEQISPWWQGSGGNKMKIDFIADGTKVICLIDCIWSNKKSDSDILKNFLAKGEYFTGVDKCFLCFSKKGFTDECMEISAGDPQLRLISLKYMK